MENQFFVDSEYLSKEALERKHRLETDPSFRKNHMEYLPGMEQIDSNVCSEVMGQVQTYDYEKYTAKDVRAALEHATCTVEDFKALLSPYSPRQNLYRADGRTCEIRDRETFWQYGISVHSFIYC